MYTEFRKKAQEDIEDIFSYIAQDSYNNSIIVIDRIQKMIAKLEVFPYLGKNFSEDIRVFVESKYRYKILYTVNEEKNTIYIVRIIKHQNY